MQRSLSISVDRKGRLETDQAASRPSGMTFHHDSSTTIKVFALAADGGGNGEKVFEAALVCGERRAYARPLERGVKIGRIVEPAESARCQKDPQCRASLTEQRAQKPDVSVVERCRCHTGKASSFLARLTHEDGFCLIIGGVGGQHDIQARTARSIGKQPVARLACGSGKANGRFGFTPDNSAMRNAQTRAKAGDGLRFFRGGGAQGVIDSHGNKPCRRQEAVEMIFEKNKQGSRVATT